MSQTTKTDPPPVLLKTHLSVFEGADMRLDAFLSQLFPDFSRGNIHDWIRRGDVVVAGKPLKPAAKVKNREEIQICAALPPAQAEDLPEDIRLDVVYEDDALLVVNKPAGLVSHPGAGNPTHTLVNGLLAYRAEQKLLPRAGLIHRLDKGTSGLLLIAKDNPTRLKLQRLLAQRRIGREYLALAEGKVISGGLIELAIGRDPHHRQKMKTFPPEQAPASARSAVTEYRIEERFMYHTLLRVRLETGRTHQIRCHLAAIGFRVCSDPLYGRKKHFRDAEELHRELEKINRQMLHAHRLSFIHPHTGEQTDLTAELPQDMASLLAFLRSDSKARTERDNRSLS